MIKEFNGPNDDTIQSAGMKLDHIAHSLEFKLKPYTSEPSGFKRPPEHLLPRFKLLCDRIEEADQSEEFPQHKDGYLGRVKLHIH